MQLVILLGNKSTCYAVHAEKFEAISEQTQSPPPQEPMALPKMFISVLSYHYLCVLPQWISEVNQTAIPTFYFPPEVPKIFVYVSQESPQSGQQE